MKAPVPSDAHHPEEQGSVLSSKSDLSSEKCNDHEELQPSHDPQQDVLDLCVESPVSVISESELSPNDVIASPVFYHYLEPHGSHVVCVV